MTKATPMITPKDVRGAPLGGAPFGGSATEFGSILTLGGGRMLRGATLWKERVQAQGSISRQPSPNEERPGLSWLMVDVAASVLLSIFSFSAIVAF